MCSSYSRTLGLFCYFERLRDTLCARMSVSHTAIASHSQTNMLFIGSISCHFSTAHTHTLYGHSFWYILYRHVLVLLLSVVRSFVRAFMIQTPHIHTLKCFIIIYIRYVCTVHTFCVFERFPFILIFFSFSFIFLSLLSFSFWYCINILYFSAWSKLSYFPFVKWYTAINITIASPLKDSVKR